MLPVRSSGEGAGGSSDGTSRGQQAQGQSTHTHQRRRGIFYAVRHQKDELERAKEPLERSKLADGNRGQEKTQQTRAGQTLGRVMVGERERRRVCVWLAVPQHQPFPAQWSAAISGQGRTRRTSGRITLHLEMMVAPKLQCLAHLGAALSGVPGGGEGPKVRSAWYVVEVWICWLAIWDISPRSKAPQAPAPQVQNGIARRGSEGMIAEALALVVALAGLPEAEDAT